MKYAFVALSAYAAYVRAQSVEACDGKAQPCLDAAIEETGICEVGDWACGCENAGTIQGAAASCVIEACGSTEAALGVLEEVQAICASPPENGDGGDDKDGDGDNGEDGGETPEEPEEPETPEEPEEPETPEEPEEPEEPETPEETDMPTHTMSTVVTPEPTPCTPCEPDGTATGEPTGTGPPVVTAGAAVVGPVAAVAMGLAALAL